MKRLDRLSPRGGVLLGVGAAGLAGAGLLQAEPWVGLAGAVAILGTATALALTGEPVAEQEGLWEPAQGKHPAPAQEPSPQLVEPLEMVELPGGTFLMGSPETEEGRFEREGPVHRVTVGAFAIGKVPVTQKLYQEVTGENPGNPVGDELPISHVSWLDAVRFCNRLSAQVGLQPCYRIEGEQVEWERDADGYRLPTEAEWEYACRAGTQTAYSFGNDAAQLGEYAWYSANSGGQLQRVGEKRPNSWGLHDLHGNVFEWCWDWFGSYSAQEQNNPVGESTGGWRVVRGGSFNVVPRVLRAAYRYRRRPGVLNWVLGFRCVRGAARQP